MTKEELETESLRRFSIKRNRRMDGTGRSKWCAEWKTFRMGEIISCFMLTGFIHEAFHFTNRYNQGGSKGSLLYIVC